MIALAFPREKELKDRDWGCIRSEGCDIREKIQPWRSSVIEEL